MGPVPRSNRRRRDDRPLPVAALEGRIDTSVTWRGSRWGVRRLTGANATRPYRCPGCEHEIAPGQEVNAALGEAGEGAGDGAGGVHRDVAVAPRARRQQHDGR